MLIGVRSKPSTNFDIVSGLEVDDHNSKSIERIACCHTIEHLHLLQHDPNPIPRWFCDVLFFSLKRREFASLASLYSNQLRFRSNYYSSDFYEILWWSSNFEIWSAPEISQADDHKVHENYRLLPWDWALSSSTAWFSPYPSVLLTLSGDFFFIEAQRICERSFLVFRSIVVMYKHVFAAIIRPILMKFCT